MNVVTTDNETNVNNTMNDFTTRVEPASRYVLRSCISKIIYTTIYLYMTCPKKNIKNIRIMPCTTHKRDMSEDAPTVVREKKKD